MRKKETLEFCKAVASSSTANLGPGFDVFGLGLDVFYDTVSIHKLVAKNGKIKITLDRNVSIPSSVKQNSASLSVMKIAKKFKIRNDLEIRITKGVPIGLGLGSSAASSAAAVIAFNELFQCKLTHNEILDYAAEGEVSSAGVKHYDNVVASLFGGFVIVRTFPTLNFVKINTPKDLMVVVCVPKIITPARKTKLARSVIPKEITIKDLTKNLANACVMHDFEIFPEREEGPGSIYVEAADKVTLKKIREMTFVNAKEVLGIIYSSKTGNTQLKWRQTRRKNGKVTGEASPNALVNLVESEVITQDWVNSYLESSKQNNRANNQSKLNTEPN